MRHLSSSQSSHNLFLADNKCHYRPQRSCGQGYVFTRVCNSVHRGSASVHAGIPPGGTHPPPPEAHTPPKHPPGSTPPGSRLRHTVNERPVRILLGCILVKNPFNLHTVFTSSVSVDAFGTGLELT